MLPYVKQITIRTTLNRSLKYIVNDNKTDYGCLVTSVNCATDDKLAYRQMIENKKNHKKEKGTLGFHFIQSFKENEIQDPYKVHEIGLKWAEKMFGNKYQFIMSTHLDKGHYHNHIILNSVSLDGKKFNACKQSLRDARDYSDDVAREYKLNVIPFNRDTAAKPYKEWKEEKLGNSWKAHIKREIDTVIKSSKSFEEFMDNMSERGYTIKQGNVKYITFKAPGMERSVRGKTLGAEYTEERIKERILFNAFHFVESKRKYKYRFKQKTNRSQLMDAARRFQHKRGSLAVNLMLTIALIRILRDRHAADAARRNVRRDYRTDIEISKLSHQLKFITDQHLKSRSDLRQATEDTQQQINQIDSVLKQATDISRQLLLAVQTIDIYNKYKPIHDEVQASALKKVLLKKKYQTELKTFEKAGEQLKKMGIAEDQFAFYTEKQKSYDEQIEKLKGKLYKSKDNLSKLTEIEKTLSQRNEILLARNSIKDNERDKRNQER